MSILNDFPEFYRDELEPRIREDNQAIRAFRATGRKLFWSGMAAIFVGMMLFGRLPWYLPVATIIGGFILCSHGNRWTAKARDGVKRLLLAKVVPSILARLDGQLTFSEAKPTKLLNDFRTFRFRPAREFSGDWLITGRYHGIPISCCAVFAVGEEKGKRDNCSTVFCGSLLRAECNKEIRGCTTVVTSLRLLGEAPGEIRMEDKAFRFFFKVFSNDEQEARYLLSPAMMKRMLNLGSKLNGDIPNRFFRICFARSGGESLVFVAVEAIPIFPFKPDDYPAGCSEKLLRTIYGNIVRMVEIVDDLDLTTRIWSKE